MHIQLETPHASTIQSYSDNDIIIDRKNYNQSVIVSSHVIIPAWPIQSIESLSESLLEPIIELNPELIILGHSGPIQPLPEKLIAFLSSKRIGLESMSIGSACRTFNVLISEQRRVVAGLILKHS